MAAAIPAASVRGTRTAALEARHGEDDDVMLRVTNGRDAMQRRYIYV
jgi:hypothetical protein